MERALSLGQEALWFLNRVAPDSAAYNVVYAVRVHGALNVPVLAEAVESTVDRHDVLRSVFTEREGVPKRLISEARLLALDVRDVGDQTESALAALVRAEASRPFDLPAGAPARLVLLRRTPDDSVLVFAAHHLALDLPSQVLVLHDLFEAYRASLAGSAVNWKPLRSTYDDFVAAERRLLDSPRADELAGYWKEVCAGAGTTLSLPTDRPRPARQRLKGASHVFQMPFDIVDKLTPASRTVRTTPARYLIGVFQALLHRYTGQSDFLTGCAAASTMGLNREGVAGYFVNTIPLRARYGPEWTLRDVVHETGRQLREGVARADYPSVLLQRNLAPSGAPGLFPVLVSLISARRGAELLSLAAGGHGAEMDHAGLRLSAFDVPQQEGQFDVTLELIRDSTAIRCALKYDTDLFDEATIHRLAEHYQAFVRAAGENPDRLVTRVPLVDDEEKARLLAFATGQSARPWPESGPQQGEW
ncbi:condensation domain-containing protein [Amycolatopsis magusensis]|uniref:Condensation domain-containing protein n=1 Tax=Amycolatopsis magusensis TaxID=882444 RepID=A0ABS4Q2X8_9PSEU|nr:condensation domain-containing protein [Amycolatopsis magusensis]MBP2185439.1 hypothetical protein [Amycolatopsis magusensis]